MRKSAIAACALALAFCGMGDMNPEDWYAPAGFWKGGIEGEATIRYPMPGGPVTITAQVDEKGNSPELDMLIEHASYMAEHDEDIWMRTRWRDVCNSLKALYEGLQAQVMLFNIAENVNKMFKGGEVVYTDEDGNVHRGTYRFTPPARR